MRLPVIPGYTDSTQNITELGRFLRETGGDIDIELLPYHKMGTGKYTRFGLEYHLDEVEAPKEEEMARLRRALREAMGAT